MDTFNETEAHDALISTFGESDLHELEGVEIFRTGKWNGDNYTDEDLDAMVDAFDKVGYRPAVKLGHDENSGSPAYGFVKTIRKTGERLVADLMDVPSKVYDAIKNRSYDSVSSEIYMDLERDGKKFPRALKAVALLGSEVPGVGDLKPLRELFTLGEGPKVATFTLTNDKDEDDSVTIEELQAKLDEQVKLNAELQAKIEADTGDDAEVAALKQELENSRVQIKALAEENRQRTIKEFTERCNIPSMRPMLSIMFDLATSQSKVKKFAMDTGEKTEEVTAEEALGMFIEQINDKSGWLFKAHSQHNDNQDTGETADEKVTRLAKQYQTEHEGVTFSQATAAVLEKNPELKAEYAK